MTIQSIRRKPVWGTLPAGDNRTYREVWPELRLNMTSEMSTVTGTITIAIVDSGVPGSNAQDRDDDGHATLLERMIRDRAARSPSLNVTIGHFKAFSAQGWPEPKGCARAIGQAAAINPDVILLAWDVGHTTDELRTAIANAQSAVIVIAAGNWSLDNDWYPNWPANHSCQTGMDHVITVMATDEDDERAFFSSYGMFSVDVAAPGFAKVDAPPSLSTLRNFGSLRDSPSYFRGTSAATAHVALVAALVRAKHHLTASQVKVCIRHAVRPVFELTKRTLPKRTLPGGPRTLCATGAISDFDRALTMSLY
jgi:subtilisin family serine protease